MTTGSGHLEGLKVWMPPLEPGAETPVHYQECEEVSFMALPRQAVDGSA